MIKEITDNQLPKLADNQQAIIEFGADWCPPCKIQRPILELIDHKADILRHVDSICHF